MFSEKDLQSIESKGIRINEVEKQLDRFRSGFPFLQMLRAAAPGDGILAPDNQEKEKYRKYFEDLKSNLEIVKFVPASGAASRMFKHLFEFRDSFSGSPEDTENYTNDQEFNSVYYFFTHLSSFPFYEELKALLQKRGISVDEAVENNNFIPVLDALLDETGMNYAGLPKALLSFHRYPDGNRTPMEEHMVEAARYALDPSDTARIHFTISPEHREKFNQKIKEVQGKYESLFNIRYEITSSIQEPATDTLAVDINNQPFRKNDGSLVFRPAGHGALLRNLNRLDSDLIFIKNIDNVVPDRLKEVTYEYKELLGGYLLWIRDKIFEFLRKIEECDIPEEEIQAMAEFARTKANISLPPAFAYREKSSRILSLKQLLNRPIRVCGMVKNEGEPGGGPFWVLDNQWEESLQIIEPPQVDIKAPEQAKIFSQSSHFNPVDLVCCIRDYKGNKFNLADFVDESSGLISQKSAGGKILKALELPGLWNGSMAGWISIFIEVPIITFNPVKTINDLLRKEHQ
ncbi:MAG: DUF4301 family protein [Bacteroidota bacterium]|nr:DUF4301 family protein [Bacteroidota bacterium]